MGRGIDFPAERVRMVDRLVRSGYLKAKELPASTLVGVTSLVQPELLLEIEVLAALSPAKPKAKKKKR